MLKEVLHRHGNVLVRRLVLEPGEAMRWHVDLYHRITVVVRGDGLAIEFEDTGELDRVQIQPGQVDHDEPTDRRHRGVNVGSMSYEEVVVFFLDRPEADPQPLIS